MTCQRTLAMRSLGCNGMKSPGTPAVYWFYGFYGPRARMRYAHVNGFSPIKENLSCAQSPVKPVNPVNHGTCSRFLSVKSQ